MWVGDLAADDGDKVGFTGGEDGFGVVGGSDPRFGCYLGMLNNRFKLRRQGGGQLFTLGESRNDAFKFQVGPVAYGDVVDMAGGVVQGNDFTQLFGIQRDRIGGGIGDCQADDEIFTTGAADAFDQQAGKAGAVFEAAAPLVGALVGPRGPELIQQGMVGGPDLNPLKS